MLLYGKCAKVLKSVCFLCKEAKETTTLDIGVYLHNRIQTEDLLGCLHQLKDDGFIEIISESGPLLHVRPTHKGRHYKEYRRAAVIGFFMKSIFTPIIVAFVTTLITITLERLFR